MIKACGQEWIRTTEVERQRIYSPPHLAALEPARKMFLSVCVTRFEIPYLLFRGPPDHSGKTTPPRASRGTRTPDLLITNQQLYQLSYAGDQVLISNTIRVKNIQAVHAFFRHTVHAKKPL